MNRFIKESLADLPPYAAGKKLPHAVKLSSNENPLGPCPAAVKAAAASLESVHRYPDGMCTALREKIAGLNGLCPENIIVGNGSDELMVFASGALINTGDEGLTSENTFSEYNFSVKCFGGICRQVPLREGIFDLDALAREIGEKTKIIFLCNPNNPTGGYFPEEELTAFLDKVPERTVVFLDEAYFDYVDRDEAPDYPDSPPLLQKYPNLIISRTYSKIYGLAAMRVGYAMGNRELIEALYRAKHAFNVNAPAQAAAEAALDDREFYDRSREMTFRGKKYLYGELDKRSVEYYKTQSNFLCLTFATPAAEIFTGYAARGIVIRDLSSFGLPRSIRYTIGTEENNRRFIEILDDLVKEGLCTI
ncbi:MAG: histidinol-phosphate transaminase [Spirochaetales bacterium]|nr:histidinol-phosphate transaminase [Spirochaetales bacterium]